MINQYLYIREAENYIEYAKIEHKTLRMKKFILSIVMMGSLTVFSQEICNDQHDNDLDYLTDCADPDCTSGDCTTSFPCQNSSQLYQISGSALREWDGTAWTPIANWTNNGISNINSIGYNVQDGFIYGINPANNDLIKIDKNGANTVSNFSIPSPNSGNWHTGDMDLDGNLYVTNMTSNTMVKVDVSDAINGPSATTITFQNMPNNQAGIADWTYNPVTGLLYGVLKTSSQNLSQCIIRTVDLNGVFQADYIVSIGNLAQFTANQSFGGTFSDSNGNLYAFLNTGRFFQFTPDATFSSFIISEIAPQGANINNNDGASCPLSNGLDTSPEDCCEKVLAILNSQKSLKATTEIKLLEMQTKIENFNTETKSDETNIDLFILHQNTPNPFNKRTTIKYEIHDEKAKKATILIFDLNGNLKNNYNVEVIQNGKLVISGETLSSGMYIYTLLVDDIIIDSKKMILLN